MKFDTIHRKVVKTLRRFIKEDDMDFVEAAESVMAKRKVMQKKHSPTSRMTAKKKRIIS